jgi:hypothetical protein
MLKRYVGTGFSIMVVSVAILVSNLALSALIWLAFGAHGKYLDLLSDILFIEAGILLILGSAMAFFHIPGGPLKDILLWPAKAFLGEEQPADTGKIKNEETDFRENDSVGWTLIFIGVMLAVFSIVAILVAF